MKSGNENVVGLSVGLLKGDAIVRAPVCSSHWTSDQLIELFYAS